MAFKTNHPVRKLGNPKSKLPYDNSVLTQKKRLIERFNDNPRLSTIEARDKMGILHPCGRIKELRARGYQIETHWIKEADANGVLHRVGLYFYKGKQEVSYE